MFCLFGKILLCTKSITYILGIKSHETTFRYLLYLFCFQFKRFKSADDAARESQLQKCSAVSTTTTTPPNGNRPSNYGSNSRVTSTFRRVNSVPETPPGPLPGGRQTAPTVVPKCSKEEIERKRQEALKKRQLNSQMSQKTNTAKK